MENLKPQLIAIIDKFSALRKKLDDQERIALNNAIDLHIQSGAFDKELQDIVDGKIPTPEPLQAPTLDDSPKRDTKYVSPHEEAKDAAMQTIAALKQRAGITVHET